MSEPTAEKALILAAGLGSRLGALTGDAPKALVPVLGTPILRRQLEALLAHGVGRVGLVLGYEGDAIRDALERWALPGLRPTFIENPVYDASNSAHSFWLARSFVDEDPYIHLNCDIIFSSSLVGRLMAASHSSPIVLDRRVELGPGMEQVRLDEEGRIREMKNVPFPGAEAKAVGIARFDPAQSRWMFDRADAYRRRGDLNRNCYGLIREAVPDQAFHGLETGEDRIFEMNTPQERAIAEAGLRARGLS